MAERIGWPLLPGPSQPTGVSSSELQQTPPIKGCGGSEMGPVSSASTITVSIANNTLYGIPRLSPPVGNSGCPSSSSRRIVWHGSCSAAASISSTPAGASPAQWKSGRVVVEVGNWAPLQQGTAADEEGIARATP